MKRALYLLAGVALIAALSSCSNPPDGPRYMGAGSSKPHYGGIFNFFHTANVRGLDPHVSFDELSTTAMRLVYDGLLDYDYNVKLVPSLAEKMPELQADGRTYRFTIRKGVYFHDSPVFPNGKGRELTAEDVRWSLTHMLDPHTHSGGAFFFMSIVGAAEFNEGKVKTLAGIKVIDRYTVDITLDKPDQTFLNAMAMTFAYPVPHENYEAHKEDVTLHPVGTGPFVMAEWERDVRLIFKKNRHYWRPELPYLDGVVYEENVSQDVAAMRFRNGDIDLMHHPRQPDFMYFRTTPEWEPYRQEEPAVVIWGFTMNTGMEPFDNVHVRRAVSFAMDRERWIKLYPGKYKLAGQMLPPQLIGYDPKLPNYQHYDLAKAKEEMRLAGFPNGIKKPVTLWFTEAPSTQSLCEMLQEDLRKIGIQIMLKQVSFTVYLQETGKPGRAQMNFGGWNQDFPDPADFLDILLHSKSIHSENSENRSFYSNPEFDALLDKARVETDLPTRTELYRKANDIAARDAPWGYIWYQVEPQVWQPYVKGYREHPMWTYEFRFSWLDEPRRRVR